MCFAPQRRALFQHPNRQKWREHVVLCTFWLGNALRATTACHIFDISTSKSGPRMVCLYIFDFEMCFAPQRGALFRHRNFQKWFRTSCVLYMFTSKCASRHNGVHFFDTSTSKSGPRMVCFVHFDFQMCFAPQRRAIFHLSSGQLAPHRRFSRAYFSTLRSPKIIGKTQCFRDYPTFSRIRIFFLLTLSLLLFFLLIFLFSLPLPCSAFFICPYCRKFDFLNFLRQAVTEGDDSGCAKKNATWKQQSSMNSIECKNWKPCFYMPKPSGAPNHWKNTVFRDYPTFSRIRIFFLLTLSLLLFFLLVFLFSLPLPCSAFHLSILSEVWLLNFLRQAVTEGDDSGCAKKNATWKQQSSMNSIECKNWKPCFYMPKYAKYWCIL